MQKRKAALLVSVFAVIAFPVLLSACNTAQGMGEDVSAAGAAITNTADDSKGY
jgi:predicted small secreted protein